MSKVLVVTSFLLGEEYSTTAKLLSAFLETYQELHPDDSIDFIDTYVENCLPLTKEILMQTNTDEDNIAKQHARKFTTYDKVVIAEPFWNGSIPASLKCYIDYIVQTNITFKYTENGPVGLLNNTRVVNLTSRGGVYLEDNAFEMGDKYLRSIMTFMGAEFVATVAMQGSNVYQGDELDYKLNEALEESRKVARIF